MVVNEIAPETRSSYSFSMPRRAETFCSCAPVLASQVLQLQLVAQASAHSREVQGLQARLTSSDASLSSAQALNAQLQVCILPLGTQAVYGTPHCCTVLICMFAGPQCVASLPYAACLEVFYRRGPAS